MPEITFEPTKHQWEFFKEERTERFLYAIAGIQGGKTFLGAMWSANQIRLHPEKNGLICAPTYKILQQSTLPKFFEIFPPARDWYKKGDMELRIPNGGTIFLRSTEEPKHIEGMTIAWAWADEIGQMKKEAHINIQGRLSIHRGKLLGTTTPYALNWLFQDVYKPWKNGQLPDTFIHQWTSVENKYFPKEEYERARTVFDKRIFARRYEGKFEKMEGLVYDEFSDEHIVDELPPQRTSGSPFMRTVVGGIDFGYTNPAAILVAGITRNDEWIIFDEYYDTQKTNDELIEKAKQFEADYGVKMWYADPAEPKSIEEMNRAGMYMRDVSKSLAPGLQSVRQLFREKRITILRPKCPQLIEELSLYHYPEPKGEGSEDEKPVKTNDHAVDALRYMVHSHNPSIMEDLRGRMRIRANRERRKREYQFK